MVWINAGIVAATWLSPGCKLVILALCSYAGRKDHCWPSIPTLARDTGLSERQVQRYLATIEKHNLGKRGARSHETNLFVFHYHPLWPADPRLGVSKMSPYRVTPMSPGVVTDMSPRKNHAEQKRAVVFKPEAVKNVSAVRSPAAVVPNGAAGFPLTFKAISQIYATSEAFADRIGNACKRARPTITDRQIAEMVPAILHKFKPRSAGFLLEKIPQVIRWQDSNN